MRALDAGRRVLKLAGIEPRGFVAPAYAYTRQLRESLRTRFAWWAGAWALHPTRSGAPRRLYGPPIGLGAGGPLRRAASPLLVRAASHFAGPILRIEVHPHDLSSASHMLALEHVIAGAVRIAGVRHLRRPRRRGLSRARGPSVLMYLGAKFLAYLSAPDRDTTGTACNSIVSAGRHLPSRF